MVRLLKNETVVFGADADVKAYVYQQIMEFEPYITSQTHIEVVEKDPKGLISQYDMDGRVYDPKDLEGKVRIAFRLNDNGSKIYAEGVADDFFSAVKLAKQNVLKILGDIQDSIVSQTDRFNQIEDFKSGSYLH